MQKWEQRQRQKVHQSRIQNAKSTFQRHSRSREKNVLSSSRSKLIHPQTAYKPTLPFLRILQIFQLEQYSNLLHFYGFPGKLAKKSPLQDIDEMMGKVNSEDKDRFISLLNTLSLMSKSMSRQQKGSLQMKRNSIMSRSQKSHLPPSSGKAPSTINKTEKLLPERRPNQSNFRIKNKATPKKHQSMQRIERKLTQKKPKITITRQSFQSRKTDSMIMDDLYITHNYKTSKRGEPALIDHSNTVIKKLFNKLKEQNFHKQHRDMLGNSEDLDLQLKRIREMYLSFDSGTLTSNISNIDIEEVIDCFTLEVLDLLRKNVQFMAQRSIANTKNKEIQQLLKESFVAVKEESKDSSKTNKQDVSILVQEEGQLHQNSIKRSRALSENSSEAISIDNKTGSIGSDSSDSFRNMNYYDSFAADFSCFDSRFQQSIYAHKPTKEDIKNFIQLVMMAGKMQKQIPVLAHVYLKRLLKCAKGGRITDSNWRNIVLVVLIEGSKIWDDQSLENNSFAKVIKPYTTLEINRLEKYLLAFIDYTLTISPQQYSLSYFDLRKHANQANKTANLIRLDLKTIKKLQSGAKKSQGKLKDFYSKCMNKSF